MITFEHFHAEDGIPIYLQIVRHIKRGIVSGNVLHGDEVPSRRRLSALLGVNPNTIQKAFAELDRAGIIFSTQGRGCFVAENAKEKIKGRMADKLESFSALASELSLSGIDEDTLMKIVKNAYERK